MSGEGVDCPTLTGRLSMKNFIASKTPPTARSASLSSPHSNVYRLVASHSSSFLIQAPSGLVHALLFLDAARSLGPTWPTPHWQATRRTEPIDATVPLLHLCLNAVYTLR